jgi:polyribonucleotide nucleotidyltransferase
MIEAGGEDIPTEILVKAIDIAQEEIKFICEKQEEFIKRVKSEESSEEVRRKDYIKIAKVDEEMEKEAEKLASEYEEKFFPTNKEGFGKLYDEIIEKLKEKFEEN